LEGSFTQTSSGTLHVELGSYAADQLLVSGPVTLAGSLALSTFPPFQGDAFTLLNNLGLGANVGTFAGLPEGATFWIEDRYFRLSYAGGTGNEVVLERQLIATAVTLSSSAQPAYYSQAITFTAIITPVPELPPGASAPTGWVGFYADGVFLGSAELVAGVAEFTISTLAVGEHSITAEYWGDLFFDASISEPLMQTVLEV
jgi:hypothetical protein